jgi:hypothetical protein
MVIFSVASFSIDSHSTTLGHSKQPEVLTCNQPWKAEYISSLLHIMYQLSTASRDTLSLSLASIEHKVRYFIFDCTLYRKSARIVALLHTD